MSNTGDSWSSEASCSPVRGFHSPTVPSMLAAGEKTVHRIESNAQDAARMPAERGSTISGTRVPQPHRAVGTRRCKQPTIRAESNARDCVRVAV